MFHILYKTTNTITGKYYIGAHSTDNLNDGYLGSGVRLRNAIKKYGKHVFVKEILACFDTREEAFLEESKIVTEEFIKSKTNYNMCPGGLGSSVKTIEFKKQISAKLKGRIVSQATRDKMSKNNGMKKEWTKKPNVSPPVLFGEDNGMYGRKHSVKSLKLMSENRKAVQIEYTEELRSALGKNSRGKKWYNDGLVSKRFEQGKQPENFILGRKTKD